MVEQIVQRDAFVQASEFRSELYACPTSRADALFDLCDALLCTEGPVRTLVDLALAPEHRRGHRALSWMTAHGLPIRPDVRCASSTTIRSQVERPALRAASGRSARSWETVEAIIAVCGDTHGRVEAPSRCARP
ncbi:hypothetical protein ACFXDJ_31465 [Streptomyces sp. NPDC059443]|uniref:hypothetical protein n=1 Tax=unclassified Streptomyces TaxID=2593676 RepID=UPI003680418E